MAIRGLIRLPDSLQAAQFEKRKPLLMHDLLAFCFFRLVLLTTVHTDDFEDDNQADIQSFTGFISVSADTL